MAKVEFRKLTKTWGPIKAIDQLSLEIEDREFLVLVGPSGCGKSTVLRCLAGLETITSGEIYIGDRLVNEVAPGDRDIAMVFQSYALYPHKTAYENLAFGLKQRKTPRDEIRRRVEEVARSLGITELLERRPKQMSGGQRQRVALGRAIVRQPQVFLFDEPLSNLDAKLRVQTRAEITRLHQRLGTTFIYVTHDQVEAMTMADRIAVLHNGVLEQVDTAFNLYNRPANVFVAGFIGSPGMNFFKGRLVGSESGLRADSGGVNLPLGSVLAERLGAGGPNREIVFGIRPEDIQHPQYQKADSKGAGVALKVEVVEMMGNEFFVHFRASQGEEIVARVDRRAVLHPGDQLDMVFDTDKVHVFDKETEKRLN